MELPCPFHLEVVNPILELDDFQNPIGELHLSVPCLNVVGKIWIGGITGIHSLCKG